MLMTSLHKSFLVYCADDWSGPWLLVTDVQLADPAADDRTVKERTLAVLRDLLQAGYIKAGDLVNFKEDTFIQWEMPVDQIIDRIRREWDALGRDPKPWEIVWFISTHEGDLALAEGRERNAIQEEGGNDNS